MVDVDLRANSLRKRQSIRPQLLSGDKKCSSNRIVFVFWEFLIDSGNGKGVVAGFPNKELIPGLIFNRIVSFYDLYLNVQACKYIIKSVKILI